MKLAGDLGRRLPLLVGAGVLASFAANVDRSDASDVRELAARLSEATGALVQPDDIRWEPSHGALSDLALGRFVLFLGREAPDRPRDVYRARVRLSPEGRPLGIVASFNLTSTPDGDDHALVVLESHAAYATSSYGGEQAITALDLSGEGAASLPAKSSDRVLAQVTNAQLTGSFDGIGRVNVTLDQPSRRVGLRLDAALDALVIDLADDDHTVRPTRRITLDFKSGELAGNPQGVRADAPKHLPKRFVHWAVDTVRAVSWIGPAPIAWLEERAFAARDSVRRTVFKMTKKGDALAESEAAPVEAAVLDSSQASADLAPWPPAPIRSMWKTPEPGEGEWKAPRQTWLKRQPAFSPGAEPAPPPFYETFVRPDEERQYAKVLLVAMDMRQLELGMEAGSEDPKPLTGPPGAGRIPRDPHVYTRVAAAFNGGFKTEHGNYGMMLNKRVLLPPVPGAATVILTKDGRFGMGSWGTNTTIGGIHDVESQDILSFRQNLDPLVDNDKVNPSNRGQWGFVLPGTSMQTERSGICVTSAGHLLYAWGDDTSATSLGKAMKMAGCVYGMHLDMNPHHTGFSYTNITEFKGRQYKSELLTREMEIDTDRYLLYAPKDFFFVMLRDPRPDVPLEGVSWEPDPGAQPAPPWMPGVWRGRASDVELLDIEPGRASFRARAGTKDIERGKSRHSRRRHGDDDEERSAPAADAPIAGTELSEDDAHRVLFALTLGNADSKRSRGLLVDGRVVVPFSNEPGMAILSISEDGMIALSPFRAGDAPSKGDAVELPMLLEGGKITADGSGARANAALGLTDAGRVLIARGPSTEAMTDSLKKAGCVRAVLLDRGAGDRGSFFRSGTTVQPRASYDVATLSAMGRPLLPRGFRFEPTNPVPAPVSKKK
jgi:hypothetical protein